MDKLLNKFNKVTILCSFLFMAQFVFCGSLSAQEDDYDAIINETLTRIETDSVDEEDISDQADSYIEALLAQDSDQEQVIVNNDTIDVLDVKNMAIRDVLELISLKSGYEFVVDDLVEAKIDIFLKDVNVLDALRIIMDTQNLAFSKGFIDGEEERIVRVMTSETFEEEFGYAFNEKIQSRIIPLQFVSATDMIDVLYKMKSSSGKIMYNEDSKTFILLDSPEVLASMEAFIKDLDVLVDTEIFALKFTKVAEISEMIEGVLSEKTGRMQLDERANTVIVTDTLPKIKEVEKLLKKLDRESKGVQIDVKVLQITLNDEHGSGVDWEAIVSEYQSLPFLGFGDPKKANSKRNLSFGTITAEDLVILTEALETVGDIKTIVVNETQTASNKQARVQLSQEAITAFRELEKVVDIEDSLGDVVFSLTPVLEEEDMLTIDVVPSVFIPYYLAQQNPEQNMQRERKGIFARSAGILKSATSIIPGIGESREERTAQAIDRNQPTEQRAQDSVKVNVEDGSTIVIGSMFKQVYVESTRKIPLLGDLPLLGFAFQNQGRQLRNTEIIVFLTFKTFTP